MQKVSAFKTRRYILNAFIIKTACIFPFYAHSSMYSVYNEFLLIIYLLKAEGIQNIMRFYEIKFGLNCLSV